jgi:hypothetical protein
VRDSRRAALGVIVAAFALLFFAEGAALATAWLPVEEAGVLQHARGGGSVQAAGGILYSAVLVPVAHSLSPPAAYKFAKALSALLSALVAVPAYLLARRLISPRASLVVAVFALAAPGSVYATAAVPDSLALLLAVSSLPLLMRAAERANRWDLLGALAFATAAAFARPWFVVLPPALLVAYEVSRNDTRSFLRWPKSLVFAGFAAFAYVLLALTAPQVGSALTDPGATARAAAASVVVAALGIGVVPWLLAASGARPFSGRVETALLLTCLPALVLSAGVFGATGDGIDERPLLVLVPLILALAARAWRSGTFRLDAAVAAGALVTLAAVALPALGRAASAHAAGLSLIAPNGAARASLDARAAAVVVVALSLLLVFRRAGVVLPAVVVLVLLAGHFAAWSSAHAEARAVAAADPVPSGWVDRRVRSGKEVYAVGPPGAFDERTMADLTLWNRSVRGVRVLDLSTVDPKTGLLSVSDTPLVLVRGTALSGAEIARSGAGVLLRPALPLQLAETVEGLYPDGWGGASTTYRRFSGPARPGKVVVWSSRGEWRGPDRPSDVRFQVGPLDGDVVELGHDVEFKMHSGQTTTRVVDVPPPPFQVIITVDPTFSPASFGSTDKRQLGAQLRFTYIPGK